MKLKSKIALVITFIVGTMVLTSVCCMRRGIKARVEQSLKPETLVWSSDPSPVKKENLNNELVPPEPKKSERKFLRLVYKLEYQFSKTRYTTCYTGFDEGDPGHGKYANQKFADKLHLQERRIKYEHNTVALCPEDKIYHEQLIDIKGTWTHRWRVHVDGVHSDQRDSATDSGYFGVPRDRMKQSKRIDFLITTAGKYNSKEQRVRNWKSYNRKVDFWCWKVYRLFDDGLMVEVGE